MWDKISTWFYNSETILWARVQLFVGVLWTVLLATDLSPVLSGKLLTYWLIISGVVTEYLRRRGTVMDTTGNLINLAPK